MRFALTSKSVLWAMRLNPAGPSQETHLKIVPSDDARLGHLSMDSCLLLLEECPWRINLPLLLG